MRRRGTGRIFRALRSQFSTSKRILLGPDPRRLGRMQIHLVE
jgi:hypothetical protein